MISKERISVVFFVLSWLVFFSGCGEKRSNPGRLYSRERAELENQQRKYSSERLDSTFSKQKSVDKVPMEIISLQQKLINESAVIDMTMKAFKNQGIDESDYSRQKRCK
ncbi:MAG: hypothetical protein HQM10_16410 [Candidatus Riflebacteria bacterium]|nr:hypothetical protein [Candidatus Riflebacteria bacterium]